MTPNISPAILSARSQSCVAVVARQNLLHPTPPSPATALHHCPSFHRPPSLLPPLPRHSPTQCPPPPQTVLPPHTAQTHANCAHLTIVCLCVWRVCVCVCVCGDCRQILGARLLDTVCVCVCVCVILALYVSVSLAFTHLQAHARIHTHTNTHKSMDSCNRKLACNVQLYAGARENTNSVYMCAYVRNALFRTSVLVVRLEILVL